MNVLDEIIEDALNDHQEYRDWDGSGTGRCDCGFNYRIGINNQIGHRAQEIRRALQEKGWAIVRVGV